MLWNHSKGNFQGQKSPNISETVNVMTEDKFIWNTYIVSHI